MIATADRAADGRPLIARSVARRPRTSVLSCLRRSPRGFVCLICARPRARCRSSACQAGPVNTFSRPKCRRRCRPHLSPLTRLSGPPSASGDHSSRVSTKQFSSMQVQTAGLGERSTAPEPDAYDWPVLGDPEGREAWVRFRLDFRRSWIDCCTIRPRSTFAVKASG
jgi:hypothetical protein